MSTYTIAPDDPTRATTTLRVEVGNTAARITELLVRAGDSDGLTAGQLPAVDLDQLLRALTPAATAALTATAPALAPTPTEPAPTPAASTPPAAAEPAPQAAEPQPAPAEAAPTARRATKSTTSARPRRSTAATKTPARGSGPAKVTKAARGSKATKAAAAKKATAKGPAPRERVYRRTPDDLAQVYQQAGSPAAVADHYGVPRHTAYGWIRTLRRNNTTTAAS